MKPDTTPKISVLIPVYNAESYLEPCLDSILCQTYSNLELIVMDDGSRDRSGGICDAYAEKDSRIAVFHCANQGVSKARNQGLQKATGDYILFVDADDLIAPDYVQKLYRALPQEKSNAISLCGVRLLNDGVYTDRPESLQNYSKNQDSLYTLYLEPLITGKIQGSSCRVLYPAKLLKGHNIQFTPCKIAEDLLFFTEVISHCEQISVCNEFLYTYRQFQQSSSHQAHIADYLPDRICYIEKLEQILSAIPMEEAHRSWLFSYSYQFYRMLLYMNATASENFSQELAQIDESIFGKLTVSKDFKKRFTSLLNRKHRLLNFLVNHRLFFWIRILRSANRSR